MKRKRKHAEVLEYSKLLGLLVGVGLHDFVSAVLERGSYTGGEERLCVVSLGVRDGGVFRRGDVFIGVGQWGGVRRGKCFYCVDW